MSGLNSLIDRKCEEGWFGKKKRQRERKRQRKKEREKEKKQENWMSGKSELD